MSKLGAAVIGLGVGRTHAAAYDELPNVDLLAIADVSEEARGKAQADHPAIDTYADYQEMLRRDDVGVVSICTPDRLHAEHAIAALDAGKHVLCEKPLSTSMEDAIRIVEKVRESGRKLMMCHNYRYVPQFRRIKELVDQSTLGDLFYGDTSYIQDLYFMGDLGPDYWRFKDPQDFYLGGAVHNVDLMRWIVGEVDEVQAYSAHMMPFYPVDDNYVSNFRFAGGAIGRVALVLGTRMNRDFFVDLNVYGGQGYLKAVMQERSYTRNVDGVDKGPKTVSVQRANAHELAIADFVQAVLDDDAPPITVMDGAKAVAICLAAIESASTGSPVAPDYTGLE